MYIKACVKHDLAYRVHICQHTKESTLFCVGCARLSFSGNESALMDDVSVWNRRSQIPDKEKSITCIMLSRRKKRIRTSGYSCLLHDDLSFSLVVFQSPILTITDFRLAFSQLPHTDLLHKACTL